MKRRSAFVPFRGQEPTPDQLEALSKKTQALALDRKPVSQLTPKNE